MKFPQLAERKLTPMSIALVLVFALSTSAFARPADLTRDSNKLKQLNAAEMEKDFARAPNAAFRTAVAGTVFYGGTVWGRIRLGGKRFRIKSGPSTPASDHRSSTVPVT